MNNMNPDTLSLNPFTRIGKDWALVSAGNGEKANTMTVSWGGLGVIWGKNAVFVFIRESRYTKEFMDSGDTFSLSFLDDRYRKALEFCGKESGRDLDKWKETGLTPVSKDGVVYPEQAELAFLCRKMASLPMDSMQLFDSQVLPHYYPDGDMHTLYIGEVLDVLTGSLN